jgi:hypothetical protein
MQNVAGMNALLLLEAQQNGHMQRADSEDGVLSSFIWSCNYKPTFVGVKTLILVVCHHPRSAWLFTMFDRLPLALRVFPITQTSGY